ncbi:hypothetical protein DFH07DRAFT_456678 [Mycena maculata]|uniref:Uncharacterized protein n=1 Tax=Mycena maculata TaxID=230809 RepID=A0AAD7NFW0_9AGAR|nr:hypothetical protein DFH07DRAFT_456678 [Mycena maculata]
MAVVMSVPEHRLFKYTGTPSEPVLVEASGTLMYTKNVRVFTILKDCLGDGLVAKGERGEIVTRALMVLAHDRAAREEGPINGLQYCRPIRFFSFLKALLTDDAFQTLMNSTPVVPKSKSKEQEQEDIRKDFKAAFQHAWISVSHFVLGDSKIIRVENLRNFFFRSAAVQCAPNQAGIDCAAPLVFAATKTHVVDPTSDIGVFQIQTKNRISPTPVTVPTHQTRPGVTPEDRPTVTLLIQYEDAGTSDHNVHHNSSLATRNPLYRSQPNNYQITLRGLTAFRLDDKEKIDIQSLLDLTSTMEAFPRADREDNVKLMRGLRPTFTEDSFQDWIPKSVWT